MEQKTEILPAIALRGLTVLPGMIIHFDISREKSIAALEKAMVGSQRVFLITQKQGEIQEPEREDLYSVGCIAVAKQLVKLPEHVIRVMVEGLERAQLIHLDTEGSYFLAETEKLIPASELEPLDYITAEAMVRMVKDKLEEYARINPRMIKEVLPNLMMINDLEELLDQTVIQIPWDYRLRQEVLEAPFLTVRYEHVIHSLVREVEVAKIKREFQMKVKAAVDKNQKDYILREQLKVIRRELGEDNVLTDADEYSRQVKALKADKEVKEKLEKEIGRLKPCPEEARREMLSVPILKPFWNCRGKRRRRIITIFVMQKRFSMKTTMVLPRSRKGF